MNREAGPRSDAYAYAERRSGYWTDDAACAGSWGLFDDVTDLASPSMRKGAERDALALCATCPVLEECAELVESLPPRMRVGVWACQVLDAS